MDDSTSNLDELIDRARDGDKAALGSVLEKYRTYLRIVADRQLSGKTRGRVDGSDIVQSTFLQAQRAFDEFRGDGRVEFVAWLKRILERNVTGAVRDHVILQKRAVEREQRLNDSQSSGPDAEQRIQTGQSTPSAKAIRNEDANRLARVLEKLPEDQQEAIRLRHLQGCSLAEIAQHLGRTKSATAGLLKRGMHALRKMLENVE